MVFNNILGTNDEKNWEIDNQKTKDFGAVICEQPFIADVKGIEGDAMIYVPVLGSYVPNTVAGSYF